MGKNYRRQAEKISNRNDKITAKYKNKPGEVFYLTGETSGTEVPYHYDEEGNLISGTLKSEEQEIDFKKSKTDLEATLLGDVGRNDGVSTLTLEEKLNLFPELNGDKILLKSFEKDIISKNEVLKKKDFIPFSYNSTEESNTSQSETPSTSETITTETEDDEKPKFSKELTDKYKLSTLEHTQKYITNPWALPTEEKPDELFNQEAYDDLLLFKENIETKEVEEITIEFDADKFKKGINTVEASGNMDYSLTNPTSSAVGPYQFLYSVHKDILKSKFGVNSKEEFIGNEEAQEGLMSHMLEDKPGRYTFMANALQKKYSEQIEELELSYTDLLGLEHFVGHGESRELFAKVRDGKITKEEFFKTVPGGLNNSIGTYLKKYRGGMVEEKGEETGFIMENPLDDPNLTAGGTDEIQADVSTELINEDVVDEEIKVPNLDVENMNTFHQGRITENLEQSFDDYPEISLYDLYQTPIDFEVLDSDDELDYVLTDYEIEDKTGGADNLAPGLPNLGGTASYNGWVTTTNEQTQLVDVDVNELLITHNLNINGATAVDWIPTDKRNYGEGSEGVLNQRRYGIGLDNKVIEYEVDKDGNNVIYIANQKEGGSIDYENKTIISSFQPGAGEGVSLFAAQNFSENEDKQNIYKGIAYQMYLKGADLTPGAIGYLVDRQYNQSQSLIATHFNSLYSKIDTEPLNYEEDFTFEDYKDFLPDVKTNLIKDLISNNIYLPGIIHGNDFESMVYDNIYQRRTTRYINKVIVDVQNIVDDPKNYEGDFFPNIDDDDYNIDWDGSEGMGYGAVHQTKVDDIDLFRQAIEIEFEKDKYDWMGKSDKDIMGGMLVRKWKQNHPDFKEIYSKKEDEEINKFNKSEGVHEIENELEDNENVGEVEPKITFIKKEKIVEIVNKEVEELLEKGMSLTDVDNYVNTKYGLDYDNETSSLKPTPKYNLAESQIYQEVSKHAYDGFNELHPEMNAKHLGLEAWEGTVGGIIFGYNNPDYDVEYEWYEENIIIPVLRIVGDPATYITGGVGGYAAKTTIGMARARHLNNMKTSVQALVNTGKYSVRDAQILVQANNAKLYNRILKSEGMVTSGLGLGLYTTTHEIAMHSTENFDDMYVGEVLKNGLVNTALGGGIGYTHQLSSRVKQNIDRVWGKNNTSHKFIVDGPKYLNNEIFNTSKTSTLNNMSRWTGKRGIETLALGAESGLFMSVHYDETKSLKDNYIENVVFLFSIKTAMSPMRLAKKPDGSKIKYKKDFKINSETLDHINQQFGGYINLKGEVVGQKFKNSGELYDYLSKEMEGSLTNKKTGELDAVKIENLENILSKLPLDVQYRYLDSRNFSVDMSLPDLLPFHLEHTEIDGKGQMIYRNHRGEVIEIKNTKDIAELSSGGMTTSEYMTKIQETNSRRLIEFNIKEDKYVENLDKKLKSHGITEEEYKNWFNGKMGKGQKYENLELSKKITDIVNNQFQQTSLEKTKALKDFNDKVVAESISNLKNRGVENPNARAIANECRVVQNKHFKAAEAVNKENTRLIKQQIEHLESLENNKHVRGYEHKDENGQTVYTNKSTGKEGERPVTTNITVDNKVDIGILVGEELTIANKSSVINALKESKKLTPELENLINESTTLKELQKIVKEQTNIESLEYKTNTQHLEALIKKENNSTVVPTGNEIKVEPREVTPFDMLTPENSESLLKQAQTPVQIQMIQDGLIVLQKLKEKNIKSEIKMHNSQESFLRVLKSDGVTVESNKYGASAYVDKNGIMHFNMKVPADKTNIYHEYKHLELDVLKKKSPEKYKQYVEEVNTLLENESALAHILAIVDAKDNKGNRIYTVEETSKDGGISTNLEKTKEYRGEEALIRIAEAVRNGTIDPKSLDAIKNSSVLNKIKIKINESLNFLGSDMKLKTSVEVLEYISNHVKDFESTKITSDKTAIKSTEVEDKVEGEGEGKLKVSEKFEDIKDYTPESEFEQISLIQRGEKLKQITIEKGGEKYRVTLSTNRDGQVQRVEKTEKYSTDKDTWVKENYLDHEPYSTEFNRIDSANKLAEDKYNSLLESHETSVKDKKQEEINKTIPEPSEGYVKPDVRNPDGYGNSQFYKGKDMDTFGTVYELPNGKWEKTGKESSLNNEFGGEWYEFKLPKEAQEIGNTKVAVTKWENGDWRTVEFNGEFWSEISESKSFKTRSEAEFNALKLYGNRIELKESQQGEGRLKITEISEERFEEGKRYLEDKDFNYYKEYLKSNIKDYNIELTKEKDVDAKEVIKENIAEEENRLKDLTEINKFETYQDYQQSLGIKQAQKEVQYPGQEIGGSPEKPGEAGGVKETPVLEGASQEVFNQSKELLNSTDLKETKTIHDVTGLEEVKGYSAEAQKLIQNLKEVKFNPESKNAEALAAEYNNIVMKISDGTATPKEINDAFIKINNLEKGEVIISDLTSSLEKHGGAIRGLSGVEFTKVSIPYTPITLPWVSGENVRLRGTMIGGEGKIGGIEVKKEKMLNRDLSTINLSMIEGYLYMEKGGEISKNITGPIQEANTKYSLSVRESSTNWFENTKVNNPAARRQIMTKMGLLLSQRERNSIDGKNVWLEIKNGKDVGGDFLRGYSDKEVNRIQKIYDNLPKLEDGSIDMIKAFENLSVTERKILKTYEDVISELREKQKITNEINGKDFIEVENYYPHLNRTRYVDGKEKKGNQTNKEFLDELYTGETNTKIASDKGKERTATGVLPIEFNLDKVIFNTINEVNRDYAYSGTLKEVNGLLNSMKSIENFDGVNLVLNSIQKRIKDGVSLQLHTNNGLVTQVMKPLYNVNYATALTSVRRLFFIEPFAETIRLTTTRPVGEYADYFKQFAEGSNRRLQYITSAGERLHGVPENTAFNIMQQTGSTGLMKANRIGMEYETMGRLNVMDKANNYFLGMVDRSQINLIWMPAFKAEFRKTGVEFNAKEYESNPEAYFSENSRTFKDASRVADRELGKWKNESTKGGKRTKIDILGLGTLDTKSEWAPIMTYMSNFGAQEVAMLQKGLKDLVRGDNAETRGQSVREVLGVFGSGVVYGLSSAVGYGFQQYYTERQLLENQLGDGDYNQLEVRSKISELDAKWEQSYNDLVSTENIKKEMITNGMFLANSKYSQAVKVVLGTSLGIMDKVTSSEQWDAVGGNQAVGLDWLEYSKELFADATYSRVPKDPEDIIMNMLPQVEMAWDVFNSEAPQAVLDYIFRGEYLADFEEEYKEDINMYKFLSSTLKVALFIGGKALPFQKDIDQTLRSMYNFYGVNIQENRELIETIKGEGSATQEYTGGPEKYTGGPEKYTGGPEKYDASALPIIRDDEGGKTTKQKKKEKEEREEKLGVKSYDVGTHKLSNEEFIAKYGKRFRWWDHDDKELREKYSQEDCKEFLPPAVYERLFIRAVPK
jgi:hypothetical protein